MLTRCQRNDKSSRRSFRENLNAGKVRDGQLCTASKNKGELSNGKFTENRAWSMGMGKRRNLRKQSDSGKPETII